MAISELENKMFNRSQLLLGAASVSRIARAKVILFGVGGVGSWCAEALVRSGIRQLTIVDPDWICVTNCNRQMPATSKTIGKAKVAVVRERLLAINPEATIVARQEAYTKATAETFRLAEYDYVIDAIDSLQDKANLILEATALEHVTLFCSMGAARRLDPLKVRETEFWKIEGDALARALRHRFKRMEQYPERKFRCVFSEELPIENQGEPLRCGTDCTLCPKGKGAQNEKRQETDEMLMVQGNVTNGSMSFVTGTFGFALASMVIQHINNQSL